MRVSRAFPEVIGDGNFNLGVKTRWVWWQTFCTIFQEENRAELKVTHLRWRSPICGFLRFSAKICGILRKSAVFCGFLRPPNAWISRRRGESAKICGFLRKSAFWALSVSLVPSPQARPEKKSFKICHRKLRCILHCKQTHLSRWGVLT